MCLFFLANTFSHSGRKRLLTNVYSPYTSNGPYSKNLARNLATICRVSNQNYISEVQLGVFFFSLIKISRLHFENKLRPCQSSASFVLSGGKFWLLVWYVVVATIDYRVVQYQKYTLIHLPEPRVICFTQNAQIAKFK